MAQNWLKHTLQRSGIRPQRQFFALVTLSVFVTLIFGGAYLSQVAATASTNREIQDLLAERDRLERVNEGLRADIASLQTVPRLLERAETLGFRPATAADFEHLLVEGYNPNRDERIVPLETQDTLLQTPRYDATFAGWLQQQVDALRGQFTNFGRQDSR